MTFYLDDENIKEDEMGRKCTKFLSAGGKGSKYLGK
jgi:hypothetical protein